MRLALLVLMAVPLVGQADDGKALAPFLDDRAFAVLRLDLTRIDLVKLSEGLTAAMKRKPAYLPMLAKEWSGVVAGLVNDGAGVVYAVASLADVPDEYPFLVVPLGEKADAAKLTSRLGVLKQLDPSLGVSRVGSALVVGGPAQRKRLQSLKPAALVKLEAGLGKDAPAARLGIAWTADGQRILRETLPELPEELGGGSTLALTQGMQWIRVDVEAAPKLLARMTVACGSRDRAEELDTLVRRVLDRLAKDKALLSLLPAFPKLTRLWAPRYDGSQGHHLVQTLDESTIATTIQPYLEQALLTAQLRRLAAAMIAHGERHGTFPAQASYDGSGKPLLSWRVHLLPFLGEEALYKEFKLDEPWNGPHNKSLLAKMPSVYSPHFGTPKEPYSTHYQVFTGPNTPFPAGQRHGPRLASFRDGLRNTVLVVEAADAVPWTRPADLVVDPKKPLPKLGAAPEAPFFGVMADGTLQRFRQDYDERTMRWIIDPADRQWIDFEKVAP